MTIPKGAFWPAMVVGLLLMNVAVVGVTVVLATRDPSFAVEANYYDKAVAWDDYARRQVASEALGWTAVAMVSRDEAAPGQRAVCITLHDAQGAPVEGALVEAVVFHNARAGDREFLRLSETGAGLYEGTARRRRDGVWVVEVTARRAGDEFFAETRAEVGGGDAG